MNGLEVQWCPFCEASLTYTQEDVAKSFYAVARSPWNEYREGFGMLEDIEQFWEEHLEEHAEEMMQVVR